MFTPQQLVHVYYNNAGSKYLMGRLLLKARKIWSEYDAGFIQKGFQLSPFKLPLQGGAMTPNDAAFDGLFGVFNDSLPDGWGRFLLDRKLIKLGLNSGILSPLDRLCFVGCHGMGALSYEPENPNTPGLPHQGLDEIYEEIQGLQEHDDDRFLDDLIALGGSSAGARPKILIQMNGEDWLLKFRSSSDPKDIGAIEYAYHLMALEAGLDVPEARLFPSQKMIGYFGVKRFDRRNHQRVHMHTMAGLLHVDHREPTLDYETLLKATLSLTHDVRECKKQFKNCVFNLLSHNRDDHAKNFSFLFNETGEWVVSPAYDLTFSSGPNGEHSTMIMGEGASPRLSHLFKLAILCNMKKAEVLDVVERVMSAVDQWTHFAEQAGVSAAQRKMIQRTLGNIKHEFVL